MERVVYPAVFGCPVFRRRIVSIWRFGWRHTGLGIIFLIFVKVTVLHPVGSIRTGHSGEVLAAALVLLDGLVKGPELTEQGHVLLPQTHLSKQTLISVYENIKGTTHTRICVWYLLKQCIFCVCISNLMFLKFSFL